MATACNDSVTEQTRLDVIREEIIQVFERILSEVRARRDVLLEQVSKMKIEFEAKSNSVVESMRGLTEMRTHLEKMSVKQNLAMKKQQESLADIDSDIEKLTTGLTNDSKFQFNCSINQLIEQVKQFGEVIDESCVITQYQSIYSKKLTAVQNITDIQDFQFSNSAKLHIDHDKQLLYVLNSRIQNCHDIVIFNANDYSFVARFGEKRNSASCIGTSKEFVYIIVYNMFVYPSLVQYRNSDYSIVKTILNLKTSPRGIFIISENQVYILTYSDKTFKFQIYDRALNFKEERDLCYEWPESEPTISAKQIQELFYILINTQLLVFTKEGKNIRSIFQEEGKYFLVSSFSWI